MFYIVSRGSTATHWVAKNLSKHQDIVCFFASRSFPPLEPGKAYPSNKETWVQEPLDASKYLDSLIMCENATHGSKVFGSIHGYHNLEMKNLVEQKEEFSGIWLDIHLNKFIVHLFTTAINF